jgi:hypothetical protein
LTRLRIWIGIYALILQSIKLIIIHVVKFAACAAFSNGSVEIVSVQPDTIATNHFHYACRDHASGFAAAAVFAANTPLFGAIEAAEVVTGFWGASAC